MKLKNTHRIRHLHLATEQAMNEALSQMELTSSQGCAMGFLFHQVTPPMAGDFEKAFHLSHASASGILSRLEKKGFIAFRTDPQDRRCKRIETLPKGEACHDHMHAAMDEINERMTHNFTKAERETFSRLLDRAIQNMGVVCRGPKDVENQEKRHKEENA